MQGGPTVRWLQRDGTQRQEAGRNFNTQSGNRSPLGRFRMLEAIEDRWTTRPESKRAAIRRARLACPGKAATLLGIGEGEDVVLVDGFVIRIEQAGLWQAVQVKDPVSARRTLDANLKLQRAALQQWALTNRSSWRYTILDRHGLKPLRGDGAESNPRIARFIDTRLIPRLRGVSMPEGTEAVTPEAPAIKPRELLARFGPNFALVGGQQFELIPYFGEAPPPHLYHIQLMTGRQFLGIKAQERDVALRRYDEIVESAVEGALRPAGGRPHPDLFSDDRYRVVRTPAGRYFVSQRFGDYCVEGRDGLLYHFDGVEFGVQICGMSTAEVLTPFAVRIFRDYYPHMFVDRLGGALALCMPRSDSYFRSLDRLPLEEALLHHLESARQTLCNGYSPANSLYHPIQALMRPVVSEEVARAQRLPIYRYDEATSA